jgi:uncharacterized membrane protein
MAESIGRFHPVLVHLPIGILLIAAFFFFLSLKEKYKMLHNAVSLSLLLGSVAAILSCITGYLLSLSGEYDEAIAKQHQWLGISTTLIAACLYVLHKKMSNTKPVIIFFILLIAMVSFTGHWGGTLTHGGNYLFNTATEKIAEKRKPVTNIPEAKVYADIIAPLLQEKCYTCHNANKQKGKLRLDEPAYILKGGKNGVIIKPANSSASELMKRVLLPREDEKHMPPKEKPQLTENDISLIHWWINNEASFTKQVKELKVDEKEKEMLAALTTSDKKNTLIPLIPTEAVEKADANALQALKKRKILVQQVAQNSNYLTANFISAPSINDEDLLLLLPVKKQLVWLKLSNQNISDAGLRTIEQLTHITKLQLDGTAITNKGLVSLNKLQHLQLLNLVGTNVSIDGLQQITALKQLQSLYLYKTKITNAGMGILFKQFPEVIIDTGNYHVSTLPADTVMLKAAKQ